MSRFLRGTNALCVSISGCDSQQKYLISTKNGPGGSRTHGRRGLGNRRSILLSYRPISYSIVSQTAPLCNLLVSLTRHDTVAPLRRAFALLASRSPRGTELQTHIIFNCLANGSALQPAIYIIITQNLIVNFSKKC